jgi:hypothetical protein
MVGGVRHAWTDWKCACVKASRGNYVGFDDGHG